MESPLAELRLLGIVGRGQFRRLPADPDRIHPLTLLFVLLQRRPGEPWAERQVGLAQVLREPMNVGRVFNLGAAGLLAALDQLTIRYPQLAVRLTRTAGLDRLTLPEVQPLRVLERYYRGREERGRK